MVESDDPSQEDFLREEYNKKTQGAPSLSAEAQKTSKKREVFARCVRTCNVDTFTVTRMWEILRKRAYASPNNVSSSSFYVEYDGFCELMPVFGTTSESHILYDLIRNGAS